MGFGRPLGCLAGRGWFSQPAIAVTVDFSGRIGFPEGRSAGNSWQAAKNVDLFKKIFIAKRIPF